MLVKASPIPTALAPIPNLRKLAPAVSASSGSWARAEANGNSNSKTTIRVVFLILEAAADRHDMVGV